MRIFKYLLRVFPSPPEYGNKLLHLIHFVSCSLENADGVHRPP